MELREQLTRDTSSQILQEVISYKPKSQSSMSFSKAIY